jgi:DoxX-like family
MVSRPVKLAGDFERFQVNEQKEERIMQATMNNPAAIIPQVLVATKRTKILYWITTVWLALGMVSTGAVQLFKATEGQGGAEMLTHLGYPVYLLTILGIWKLLGVVAVLIPKFSILKEWAYAGFFFVLSGAIFSHIASGDPVKEIFPALLLLILTAVSWYFRPAERKITKVNQ